MTMRSTVRIALATGLVFLLASAAVAQDWKGRGRLQGQVMDPEGKPYPGARVMLMMGGVEGQGPDTIITDKKGRWAYLGLAGGTWTVRIESDEYVVSEGSVSVSEQQVGPGNPLRIDLRRPTAEELASSAADLILQGNTALQEGRYGEARGFYEQALPDTPENNRAAVVRGIAQTYSLEGQKEPAIAKLQESLALDPDDTTTLRLTIDLLLAMDRKEEAEAYMAKLPEGEKLDFPSRLNLGIDLYNQNDYDGALEHFAQAVSDYPDEADGHYYSGMVFLAQEKNAEALESLRRFLELAPADNEKRAEAESFVEYLAGL